MGTRYGLQIRAAVPADAPALAELMAASGRPVPASDLERRIAAFRAAGGTILLALEWGPPSGVLALSWSPTLDAAAPVAQISTFLVAPDDRRRGIGRALLKAGAQAARAAGCDVLLLPVPEGADDLGAFGDATGFVRHGAVLARPLRKAAGTPGRGRGARAEEA